MLRANKKIKVDGSMNRKFMIDEKLSLITSLEYNPRLGCCEEKQATLRFVTYKTVDK